MKICKDCQIEQPEENFRLLSHGYLASYCKPCDQVRKNAATTKWRKTPGSTYRSTYRARLIENYGIKVVDFERMKTAQDDTCAICKGTNDNGRDLSVDHCHTSGDIRGLLCSNCNSGLGMFKDNPELLYAAIEYLIPHLDQTCGG